MKAFHSSSISESAGRLAASKHEKERVMNKKSALINGSFTATETGFTGKLGTLAIKANVQFERTKDKEKDSHPDYTVLST
jgi:hypothetical protein